MRTKVDTPPPPPPNSTFGPYMLVDRLAVGGMAEVFRALEPRQVGENRLICVKRMLPHIAAEAGARDMFVEEARLGRIVDHPNVVGVLDFGEAEGQPYLSLEYVPGCDLWRLSRWLHLEDQSLPFDLCVYILRSLVSALDAVHTAVDDQGAPQGIVHRDVSPSNLLLSVHGDVKLGDFGIAEARMRETFPTTKLNARAKGKLGYLAPEQVAGGAVDERADLFSAGIIGAELMMGSGKQLFRGASELAVLLAIRDANIKPFLDVLRTLPAEVGALVVRMLSPDPDNRPATAREIRDALDAAHPVDEAPLRMQLADLVARATGHHLVATSETPLDLDDDGHVTLPEPSRETLPPTPLITSAEMLEQITEEVMQITYAVQTAAGERLAAMSFAELIEAITTGSVGRGDLVSVAGGQMQRVTELEELKRHFPQQDMGPVTRDQLDNSQPAEMVGLAKGGFIGALAMSIVRKQTGLWMCEQGSIRKEVYFEDGTPVFVASNLASELLGEYLVTTGVLSRGELDMALAVMPRFEGKLGDTLVALGLVDPVQLFRHIAGQVQEKLLEMFLWNTGQAAFYPNVKGPEDRFPLHIVPWELMIEGTRRRVAHGLEDEIIRGRDDDDLVRVMRVPTEVATAELPGECSMLMQLAETPRSLGALVAAIDDPMGRDRHRGVRTVLLMMRMGVLRWLDE